MHSLLMQHSPAIVMRVPPTCTHGRVREDADRREGVQSGMVVVVGGGEDLRVVGLRYLYFGVHTFCMHRRNDDVIVNFLMTS